MVTRRVEVEGFGPWTVKSGLLHVAPPFDLLAGIGNVSVVLLLLLSEEKGQAWGLSLAIGIRAVGIGINLLYAKLGTLDQVDEHFVASIGLSEDPYVKNLAEKVPALDLQLYICIYLLMLCWLVNPVIPNSSFSFAMLMLLGKLKDESERKKWEMRPRKRI